MSESDLYPEKIGPARLANGRVVSLHLADGFISRIEEIPQGEKFTNHTDLPILFPGLIDMHVHFRQPGSEHKETILTGANAAICGGVTTVGDMPNNVPLTDSVASIQKKMEISKETPCSIFFHIAAGRKNFGEIENSHKQGITKAIKLYMGETTGVFGLDKNEVSFYFQLASDLDLVLMVHAEDNTIIEKERSRFPSLAKHHADIRSIESEKAATCKALELAAKYAARLYLCHVSNSLCFEEIVSAKKSGVNCFIEVTPHHLHLDRSLLEAGSGRNPAPEFYQVNPPLREIEHTEYLQSKLFTDDPRGLDQIDSIGSDHAPHLVEEKKKKYPDSPSGLPGSEFFLSLIAEFYHRAQAAPGALSGRINLLRLQDLLSTSAAKIFSLADRGEIKPGKRADFVLWDENEFKTISETMIKSKCGWSPYKGMSFHGWPREVYILGRKVG